MPAGKLVLVAKGNYGRKKVIKKPPKVSKSVKTYVDRKISSKIEDKKDWNQGGNIAVYNIVAGAPFLQTLNWQTGQQISGSYANQGTRVGNQIHVKKALLKCSLVMRAYDSVSNPFIKDQLVTLYVFKLRQYANGTNPTYATYFSKMFQQGNSVNTLTNTPTDHILPFNTDLCMIKAVRRFKMGFATQSTFTQPAQQPNNDFSYQKFITVDLTKFYKKMQRWNDGTTDANNDNLFFAIFAAPADNSATVSGVSPIILNWFWDATFEDA